MQNIQNTWIYGEVGDRLLAQRTSQIYKASAKTIVNMLITNTGTLRIAKKFDEHQLNINGNIIDTLDTSKNYYLLLTSTSLYLIKKSDNSIIKTVTHGLNDKVKMNIISRYKLIVYDGVHNIKIYGLENNDIILDSNAKFFNPMDDKEELQLDIYQMVKDPQNASKLIPFLRSSTVGKKTLIEIRSNKMYAINSTQQINRIYTSFNPKPDINSFTDPKLGEMYGMLKIFYKVEDGKQYVIENQNVTLGTLTTDAKYKGDYFTELLGNDESGIFGYGKLIDISVPEQVSFHQDRLVFYKDGYLYFSKRRDYLNFRNDEDDEDAFYKQLTPINNRRGDLLGMISSKGLFVITEVGIYIIGYGSYQLTPKSINGAINIVSSMDVLDNFIMVENDLFFLNKSHVLKSLSLDTSSQQLFFNLRSVDQYAINPKYDYLTSMSIEDRDYLIAIKNNEDVLYLFEPLGDGIFRRSHLSYNGDKSKILTLQDRLITQSKIYSYGQNNYDHASIFLNPPALKDNSMLCDASSSISNISTKFINEDRDGILGVKINNTNIQNLGLNVDDKYNIYKIDTSFGVENGYGIDIYTKQNDKVIELQSIQMELEVVEDN